MLAQTRFKVAFDSAQGAGLQILAGVDRYRCSALSALDAEMRADLSRLDASPFVEDAPQPPARHLLNTLVWRKQSVKITRHFVSGRRAPPLCERFGADASPRVSGVRL